MTGGEASALHPLPTVPTAPQTSRIRNSIPNPKGTNMAWPTTSRHKRGYGRQHVQLRAHLLAIEPLCRMCKAKGRTTPATIADHIRPLAQGGAMHDLSNLQPVCADCHQDKTNADKGHRVKKRISIDGWPVDD